MKLRISLWIVLFHLSVSCSINKTITVETGCERPLVIEIDRREIDSNKVYPSALKANNGIAMHIVPVN